MKRLLLVADFRQIITGRVPNPPAITDETFVVTMIQKASTIIAINEGDKVASTDADLLTVPGYIPGVLLSVHGTSVGSMDKGMKREVGELVYGMNRVVYGTNRSSIERYSSTYDTNRKVFITKFKIADPLEIGIDVSAVAPLFEKRGYLKQIAKQFKLR